MMKYVISVIFGCMIIITNSNASELKDLTHTFKLYYITTTDIPISFDAHPLELKNYAGIIVISRSSAIDIYEIILHGSFLSKEIHNPNIKNTKNIDTVIEFTSNNGEKIYFYGAYDRIYNSKFQFTKYSEYSVNDLFILRMLLPGICYSLPQKENEIRIYTMINMSCYDHDNLMGPE